MRQAEQPIIPVRPVRYHRTLGYRLLVYGLVLFGIMGWLRVGQTIGLWQMLTAVDVWPGPVYLAVSGTLWGLAGFVAAVGLWFRFRWSRAFAIAAALFIAVSYWVDRLFVVRSSAARVTMPFAAALTLALLAYTLVTLRAWQPRS